MVEKERYKLESYLEAFCEIHDTESDEWYLRKDLVTDLLNRQDARIKELEKIRDKGNQKLEDFYNEKIDKLDSDYNKHFNELIEENQQLEEKLNNFETCMKKYNVEDIEHLDLMLFVLSSEIKYHLKEIKDKHKKEFAVSRLEELFYGLQEEKYATIFGAQEEPIQVFERSQVLDYINNRIEKLKGESK